MKNLLIYILIFILFFSCKKEQDALDFSISLNDTFPLEIIEFKENIVVKINYQHPDGYVGFSDPDALSLEIKDSRLFNADYYHLIPINPPSENLSVKGQIEIEIDSPFILGNDSINTETLFFSIRIKDSQLEWSNVVETPKIVVTRE